MKPIDIAATLLVLMTGSISYASNSCAPVDGKFEIMGERDEIQGVMSALRFDYAQADARYLVFESDAQGFLSVQLMPQIQDPLKSYAYRTIKGAKEFSCNSGWWVVKASVKSYLNVGVKSYEGFYELKFRQPAAKDENDSLNMKLTFNGQKVISLFSYDSAHLDMGIPWDRISKKSELSWWHGGSLKNDAEAAKVVKPEPPKESQDVQNMRLALSADVLGNVQLVDVKQSSSGVFVSVYAPKTRDVDAFKFRLNKAGLIFSVEEGPTWTSRGYLIDLKIQ